MRTLKLEIEDSKLDIVLNIIQNLKDDLITKYDVVINEKRHQNISAKQRKIPKTCR